jgi:hypothetical protein
VRQQIFEDALKRIVTVIEETGSTSTHDAAGDRRRANMTLKHVVDIARDALKRDGASDYQYNPLKDDRNGQ